MSDISASDYAATSSGYFSGILKWDAFDDLWARLRAQPEGWYVYSPGTGEAPPTEVLEPDALLAWLDEAETLLRTEGDPRSCGTVYVDDRNNPSFVKIFHPQKMGTSCSVPGAGHAKIWPWWTLTQLPPVRMVEPEAEKSRSVFDRLMGRP